MTPKRDAEIPAARSIVIRGELRGKDHRGRAVPRQGRRRTVSAGDAPKVIAVSPRPMRPFQGWRYFTEDAAPPDLGKSAAKAAAAMPEPLRRELRDLGLL
jgi:hypothetical protein